MPAYVYFCPDCETYCDKHHGMFEEIDKTCPDCHKQNLFKTPTKINIKEEEKAGKLVKEFIELNKETVKEEKERLSKQEFNK
jgi:predicted nucleic acid-binding Zn ribbon protein